jgi:hypothetical protein
MKTEVGVDMDAPDGPCYMWVLGQDVESLMTVFGCSDHDR